MVVTASKETKAVDAQVERLSGSVERVTFKLKSPFALLPDALPKG